MPRMTMVLLKRQQLRLSPLLFWMLVFWTRNCRGSEDDGFCEADNIEDCEQKSVRVASHEADSVEDEDDVPEASDLEEHRAEEPERHKHHLTENSGFRKPKRERYLRQIAEAVENYVPCDVVPQAEGSACFLDVIAADLSYFDKKRGLHQEDIDRARKRGVLYQIIDHKVYRQHECTFPSRCAGVEHFLTRVARRISDVEFVVNVHDYPQVPAWEAEAAPVFSFSKTDAYRDILYPAWAFWAGGPAISIYPKGIGRWDTTREVILNAAEAWPWDKKLPVGFFRGSRTSSGRDPLVLLSRNRPDLVDAQYTKNQAWKSLADTLGAQPASEVPFEDHCRYKYLFNFHGVAASFRLKHLFLCDSLVLNVESAWVEYFYPALQPWVHYVPVKSDLSDVEEVLEFVRANDEAARAIADRGKEFIFRHLTMESVEMYWEKLLRFYGSLLRYPVKLRPDLREMKG